MSLLLLFRPSAEEAAAPPDTGGCNLLLEDGGALLQEDGDNLLTEDCEEAVIAGRRAYSVRRVPYLPDRRLLDDEEILATLSTHHPNPLRPH